MIFGASIADNIAVGNPDADRDAIIAAAKAARADEFIARLSDRYETVVGERGVTLSGVNVDGDLSVTAAGNIVGDANLDTAARGERVTLATTEDGATIGAENNALRIDADTLRAEARNLGDNRHARFNGFAEPGRQVWFGLSYAHP